MLVSEMGELVQVVGIVNVERNERNLELVEIMNEQKRKQSLQARYVYGFVFLATNILAWFVRDYGHIVFYELHCEIARIGAGEPPNDKCKTQKWISDNSDWTTVLGFLVAIFAIAMATFSTGIDSQSFQFRKIEVQSDDEIPYRYDVFHFIFSMGAMYFAMLFISWELDHTTKSLMRRRLPVSIPHDEMEKFGGKQQSSRLCFLATLSGIFWFLIFYFHFAVLNTSADTGQPPEHTSLLSIPSNFQHLSEDQSDSERLPSYHPPPHTIPSKESDLRHESKNYPFLHALKTVENKSDPCGGRYIYVHDLPSQFNEDMLRECRSLNLWTNFCKFTTNAGLGPPLENVEGVFSNTGWYATNQFTVDVIFSNRMKQYECLTKDSSIAAAVFVPFYAGFDIARTDEKTGKEVALLFAGAPRPDNPKSIRGQLIDQCKKSSVCKLLECDFGESKCHSPSSIMQMFQSSLFCLQPQGDSYTRRSAFDSMLAGCIPVFFHPGSAYTQYTWHLPKNYSRYSVFIPEDDIRKKNVSIEVRLKQISPDTVKTMREVVINLIPRLIYADPRSKLETLQDAFDVSVQAIIDKVTALRKDIIAGHEDKDFIEENSWKYALLEEGQLTVGAHEWDPFFSKPKDANSGDSGSSSTAAAKKSWKNEQRNPS
ncbi:hypothetical protein J5N97_023265 [Dioscorea zingiberensis]|uniref:Exostosin GT47 domain-containing protein n=1 Tax=Dioscorea zingiberensis TaxID=325984 RepID=A0A9D5CCN9_9LILI|nr:hypothetical protein J5N97_023265 [Dioscorea zingiberensis]